jgi:hypothetical protein
VSALASPRALFSAGGQGCVPAGHNTLASFDAISRRTQGQRKVLAKRGQSCDNWNCLDCRRERPLKTRHLVTGSRHSRCCKALTDDLDSQVAVCSLWSQTNHVTIRRSIVIVHDTNNRKKKHSLNTGTADTKKPNYCASECSNATRQHRPTLLLVAAVLVVLSITNAVLYMRVTDKLDFVTERALKASGGVNTLKDCYEREVKPCLSLDNL